jgi:hypothetical protein
LSQTKVDKRKKKCLRAATKNIYHSPTSEPITLYRIAAVDMSAGKYADINILSWLMVGRISCLSRKEVPLHDKSLIEYIGCC